MEQRVGTNQRQQRTEIPTLPNGECKNTIRQLLCKGNNVVARALRMRSWFGPGGQLPRRRDGEMRDKSRAAAATFMG
jgi:hypothetical protein